MPPGTYHLILKLSLCLLPLQLMVLLTAGLRPANPRQIKLQCLEGWLGLVVSLAEFAPVQLGGIVSQVGNGNALTDAVPRGGASRMLFLRSTH